MSLVDKVVLITGAGRTVSVPVSPGASPTNVQRW